MKVPKLQLPDLGPLFFDRRFSIALVFATTIVGFSGDALYDFAKDWAVSNERHWKYLFLYVLGILVVFLLGVYLKKVYAEITHIVHPGSEPPAKKQALIVLCSNEDVARKAVMFHQPELKQAWLLATDKTNPWACKLRDEATTQDCSVEVIHIKNEADWREVSGAVRDILLRACAKYLPSNIIVDFTGMTKPASVGAALSALQFRTALQYIGAKEEGEIKIPLDPAEVKINYEVTPSFAITPIENEGQPRA
jgi:hypothetical protein